MVLSDSPVVAEILALTGYDHIVVDHEHSTTNVQSGQQILQAIQSTYDRASPRTEAIVRLPSHDIVYMKKVLDTLRLPGGVMVPMVDDAETAREVVKSTRYPRQQQGAATSDGVRGCAAPFIRASAWGKEGTESYLTQCNNDLLVMVQVETEAGVEAIPEIAHVEGIDAIFIGPLDLSCSIGKMGQFDDSQVQEIISRAESSILKSGCLLAGFRPPGRSIEEMFDAGYSLVCGSADVGLLQQAAQQDLRAARQALKDQSDL